MAGRVAVEAGGDDVVSGVSSAFRSSMQVLGGTAQQSGLSSRNSVLGDEGGLVLLPDWRLAVVAAKRLLDGGRVPVCAKAIGHDLLRQLRTWKSRLREGGITGYWRLNRRSNQWSSTDWCRPPGQCDQSTRWSGTGASLAAGERCQSNAESVEGLAGWRDGSGAIGSATLGAAVVALAAGLADAVVDDDTPAVAILALTAVAMAPAAVNRRRCGDLSGR